MKTVTFVGIVMLAGLTATAQEGGAGKPASQTKTAATASGSAAIKQVADSYVKATLAGDAKAVGALYTEDAVEMPPNQPMIKGRSAIEQYYAKLFGGGMKIMNFTLDHLDSRAMGDNAWDVGTYKQSMQGETGTTTPSSDSGKYVVLLKRVGGAWKVAYAIYNSDTPPQAGR
jgi:uncharacterized protein (TIGR02246 family)